MRLSLLYLGLLGFLGFLLAAAPAQARSRYADKGWLRLTSMTAGATVSIDGQEVGTLPFPEPIPLAAGKHTLKIVKRGYTEYLDVFGIKRGKTTDLDIDLLPYAGILVVTSRVPEARVFIDGKFEGTTPLEVEVLIGKRSVRVAKAGYYDFIATVSSIAGKVFKVRARMKPLPIGSNPYRPRPAPPPRWFEKWYVWAGIAGGVAAVTLAIVIPVTQANKDQIPREGVDFFFSVRRP
jgi:hypothetical protein